MARRPSEPTANPARGAALVVVAVLIGLFLLRNGLDSSTSASGGSGGSDQSSDSSSDEGTDTAADEGTDSDSTTPVSTLRSPAQVPTTRSRNPPTGRSGHGSPRRAWRPRP